MNNRLIAIGDIHGEYNKLENLLQKLFLKETDYLIFLGDYIDRGLYSRQVVDKLIELADAGVGLIVTTGGTGFSLRDCTPEATAEVCSRMVPGIPEAMRNFSMQVTRRAMLSRAVAGIRKRSLIVNLPGSPKAVDECLNFILPEIRHGIEILRGDADD